MDAHCTPSSGVTAPTSSNEFVKLRQSCDQCQNIKVRCSRDKPCKRCTRRRLECVYSPVRRIGRPRKQLNDYTVSSGDDDHDDGENHTDESRNRAAALLSPSNSINQGTSTVAASHHDTRIRHANSRIPDVRTGASTCPSLATQCQSGEHLTLTPDSNDALFRSVVDTWVLSDHQISASSHIASRTQTTTTNAGPSSHRGAISATVASSYCPENQDQSDCYEAVLTQTVRLEQALARTASPTPIDLVLETEHDFNTLYHRLFTCTGHIIPTSPAAGDSQSPFPPQMPKYSVTCLASERPVLLGLSLLAERVVGMLEDMFRLAARAAQTADKASDFVWAGTPETPSLSARRIHRSLRNMMARPCASVDVESYRSLRVDDFDVQGQAKSDAMGRILKLRAQRVFEALDGARRAEPRTKQGREQSPGGPLDWGGSGTVFEEITRTLLDDLIRRMESLLGALVLL
ncbi:hypothetical protein ANO14919_051050 [Xylariales sp. No.14919]|nr:hypothetical protein ANO14919_051050 [Xylariales sp. No.14919]